MPRQDSSACGRARAAELERLAELLVNHGACSDPGPLYAAASECRTLQQATWGCSLERLRFQIHDLPRVVPSEAYNVAVELSLELRGEPRDETFNGDPLAKLELDILLTGDYKAEDETRKLLGCWHLDRDLRQAEDGVQQFMHPHYHLQYGGKRLWSSVQTGEMHFGSSLVLEAPRIAHPPLDAILGVDFLLTNYFPADRLDIRGNGDYRNLIKASQERLWRPYAYAISHCWYPVPDQSEWTDHRLWPQLIT
jgi:hypothetical protein